MDDGHLNIQPVSLAIDLERCIGCKSCEVACKQEHGLGPGTYRNRVLWLTGADKPQLDFLTVTCQHCDRPACLRACPVVPKAISKDAATGVVSLDTARCVGCGECVVACPYGAIGYDAQSHHAVKCDLCADRRGAGLGPACAEVCPGKAITFDTVSAHRDRAAAEDRMPLEHDPYLLGPQTMYLDRVSNNGAPNLFDVFTERRQPALMDDPGRGEGLSPDRARYPYGAARKDRTVDRVVPGGCNICFNCCTTNYHFSGEKLVRISGNPDDPVLQGRVCPKSQLSVQLYGSENRLTQPLKRVGARGENKFEPISWDQALDEIADRLRAVRKELTSEALAIFSGTRTGIITNRGYIRLFAQMWGTPNVETTEPFCSSGKNMAFSQVQGVSGSGNSYTDGDIGSAAMYLFLGDNQAETRPVYFGMVNDWRLRNKAKMVVVDPRFTVTASKADTWHAIRPGTDLALVLALCYEIFANEWHDRRFCENWVLGWEEWRNYLIEKRYNADWAAPITDISAENIRQLARDIAEADGCVMFASRGLNQHTNSMQTNRAMLFLSAITGNTGRPGGGYMNMTAGVPIEANAPEERRGTYAKPRVRMSPVGWTKAMTEGRPYPLKALIACNNPMSLWPDQKEARAAMEALDLLVHIDLFPNETSAYADYVLPAATGIEKGEIGRSNDDRRVVWIDRIMDPPGEAKPDGWIWTELGKRLGYGDVLTEEFKDPAVLWDKALIDNDKMRGCTQKRLHSVPYRWVRYPVATEDAPEIETLYMEGTTAVGATAGHRFPTASGKLEFYTPELDAQYKQLGLGALPEFYSEREQLVDLPYLEITGEDADDEVVSPLIKGATYSNRGKIVEPDDNAPGKRLRNQGFDTELVTGRPPAPHFHSWTHFAWQAQEMWADLYAQIHPDKAVALGIEDGQRVRVETSHGAVEARAWITAAIRPTAIFMPIGWGERQPYHPWRPVNFLTDKSQRDPLSDQTNLKTYLCKVTPL